jgi:RNA ligase
MINYSEIQKRIESGLIISRKHPNLPLEILNYTQKVQFDRLWDDYTKMCRGLILDEFHNIVARPFQKFFNLGETSETMIQNLPNEIPQITEKLDGSLGILYFDNLDYPAIATRGSFESEQAMWATDFIRNKKILGEEYDAWDFKQDYTYLFEIVCPESKNIVDYKEFQGLVLLAVISNKDGTEINHKEEAEIIDFPYAKTYDFEDISHVVDFANTMSGIDLEGFVCKYSNGLRLKIKSDDYKRLHKILSRFNEKDIWEALSQGKSLDSIAELVPDEFFEWIKVTQLKFWNQRRLLIEEATKISVEASVLSSRKDQAIFIMNKSKDKPRGFSGLIFNILDGNTEQAEKSAWNLVKP